MFCVPADFFLTVVYFPANSDYLFVSAAGKVHREPGANKSYQHLNEALSLVSSYKFLFRCVCFAGLRPDLSVSACCLAAAGRYTCSGSGSLCILSLCQVPLRVHLFATELYKP